MKILFPLGMFYPTTVGGPSSTLYWHTCYLKKQGLEPYIVTTDFKLDWGKNKITLNRWIDNKAGKVIYCKTKYRSLPFRAFFETIVKMFSVDIVHYSSAYYYLTIYTIFIALLLRKKVILSPRGEFFPTAIDSTKKKLVIRIYKIFQKKIIFHATSEEEIEHISALFPLAQIYMQPNFINLSTRKKNNVRSKNIVFLGIIYAVKKLENLIKAIALSQKIETYNGKLLIAGKPLVERDFTYKRELDRLIEELGLKEKIEFVGEIFGKDKEDFLNDAYILVLPSESENFGNVVVEALAQSTPVIASKGTPWKYLDDYDAGWWIENDPNTLSVTIDKALSLTDEEYLRMCNNAVELVQKKFNINTSDENCWINIYQKIIKNGYNA